MPRYAYIGAVVCFLATLAAAVVLYVEGVKEASDVFKLAGVIVAYLAGVHTPEPRQ